MSAPDLAPQTRGQTLEPSGVNPLHGNRSGAVHDTGDTATCRDVSNIVWRPPDEAFTQAPEVPPIVGTPCKDAAVAGSNQLAASGIRMGEWFARQRIAEPPFGFNPAGIGAPPIPTTGSWRRADLRLLSVVWGSHQAVVGMTVQPVVSLDDASGDVPANGAEYRVGLYARDDWQLSPALAATLGLRIDHDTAANTQLRPRIGLAWRVGPSTSIKALYGRARHTPAAGERDYGDGSILNANPLQRVEQTEALEIEAEQRVGSGMKLHAVAYAWTVRDVTALGGEAGGMLSQVAAGESVEARGFEMSANQMWAMGARLRGSASLQDATTANGTPLLASPQWFGKLLLSTPLPWAGLWLGYEWQYDGERIGFDGSTAGAFAQSNLNLASTQQAKGLEWSMSVLNLFDMHDPGLANAGNASIASEQGRRNVQMRLAYQF